VNEADLFRAHGVAPEAPAAEPYDLCPGAYGRPCATRIPRRSGRFLCQFCQGTIVRDMAARKRGAAD